MTRELEVVKTSGKSLGKITVTDSATVRDVKNEIHRKFQVDVERQSIRDAKRGKDQKDTSLINRLPLESHDKIYVKDLGPQIGWNTVFYCEYAGPIFLYGLLFLLPHCFYGADTLKQSKGVESRSVFPFNTFPVKEINEICGMNEHVKANCTAYIAGILWTIHYAKRILETAFVHRFSHGTMPIFNLFKNCSYYWGFALYVAYHINHPLHTPPPTLLFYLGAVIFILCEFGNLSVHLLLRNLRPEGTNIRKIPLPNSNPFTNLFNFVSCPNYTYEFGAWVGFSLLTACLPAFIFGLAGLYQMTIWAIAKHKKYISEFPNYPRRRAAIIPFFI